MLSVTGAVVFSVGVAGFAIYGFNLLTAFVAVEFMMLGVAAHSASASLLYSDVEGQYFLLVVLAVAAAESALGLAVLVQYYRLRGQVNSLASTVKG